MVIGSNRPAGGRGKNPEARPAPEETAPHKAQQPRGGHGGRAQDAPQQPEGCGWLCAAGCVRLALWGSVFAHK